MTTGIMENDFIDTLTRRFPRSPLQRNALHESDAEIIRFPGSPDSLLAITTDTIAEEISCGLYADPYLIGWMSVMVNMSDLAAVGAEPLGMLLSEIIPKSFSQSALSRLQEGIQDACSACGTYILGGDTNSGPQLVLTGCAVGRLSGKRRLSRTGCKPGDLLYSTGLLGNGNAFALSRFMNGPPIPYQPVARLKEGRLLSECAGACMDTSDGMIATLDQLMRVNRAGFSIDLDWETALSPDAKDLARRANIPLWMLLAGQHGEYELIFTAAPEDGNRLIRDAGERGWNPVRLGRVTAEQEITLCLYGKETSLDTGLIRNIAASSGEDAGSTMRALLQYDTEIQKGVL